MALERQVLRCCSEALTAAIPVVAAVGAASSLALDVAEWGGMRLFSFVGRETASRHVFRTR